MPAQQQRATPPTHNTYPLFQKHIFTNPTQTSVRRQDADYFLTNWIAEQNSKER